MPILSTRIEAKAVDNDGNEVAVPPLEALRSAGPRMEVLLSPLESQVQALAASGVSAPSPVHGWALIDTGATATCVDRTAAEKAGLAVVDSGPMSSATHPNEIVPIYAGQLMIRGLCSVNINRAYGAVLETQGLVALIGRDILSNCQLVYDGHDGSFTLAI